MHTTAIRSRFESGQPTRPREFSHQPQDIVVLPPGSRTVDVFEDASTDRLRLDRKLEPGPGGDFVYPESEARFTGAAALSSAEQALKLFTSAYGQPLNWATGEQKLVIHPDEGQDLNAFYTRVANGTFQAGLSFFHSTDPKNGQEVFTGRSGEIVSHEAGHAILDAVRPGYFGTFSLEVAAFHEAFGDVLAMLTSLQDDRVVARLLEQTGGDLSLPNLVAATGEQMGIALNHFVGINYTGGDWIRNLNNERTWTPPSPGSEAHEWSLIWSGATYDMLAARVAARRDVGQPVDTAVRGAASDLLAMYARLLQPGQAPDADFTYAQMAQAWIRSEDQLNDGRFTSLIEKTMRARGILPADRKVVELPEQGSHWQETVLPAEPRFGALAGCRVRSLVSGEGRGGPDALVLEQVADLLARGDILLTLPGVEPAECSWRKANGEFYRGVVRWDQGQAILEPVPARA